MTRKDFEAIAAILRENALVQSNDAAAHVAQFLIALQLADYFETVNPRFNRTKFLIASGFELVLTRWNDTLRKTADGLLH